MQTVQIEKGVYFKRSVNNQSNLGKLRKNEYMPDDSLRNRTHNGTIAKRQILGIRRKNPAVY